MVPNKYQRRLRSQTPDLWTAAATAVKQSEEGEREREMVSKKRGKKIKLREQVEKPRNTVFFWLGLKK